jgi:6-phosphofructokinase 2
MSTIVTVTMNPAIDMHTSAGEVKPEIKIRCDRSDFYPGGGGINVSRAITKLGGEAAAIYPAGGQTGSLLDDLLESEAIQRTTIPVEAATRLNLTVTERGSGQQYRFTVHGSPLKSTEWERLLENIAELSPAPSYVVASGSLPPGVPEDFYVRLGKTLEKHPNTRYVIDTSGRPLQLAVSAKPFLIKPNRREIQELVDCEFGNTDDFKECVSSYARETGIEAIVVSAGSDGVVLAAPNYARFYESPEVPLKSKIGAGDSMVAGVLTGLAEQMSMERAVLRGIAAGASAVMSPGTELCSAESTREVMAELAERYL